MKKKTWAAFVASLFCFVISSCVKDKIDFVGNSQIALNLLINDLYGGSRPAPIGTKVTVVYTDEDNVQNSQSFQTTEAGKYIFRPQAKGNYMMMASYRDDILQFDPQLVEDPDFDSTRSPSKGMVTYSDTSGVINVNKENKIYNSDLVMNTEITGLKLKLVDEQNNTLNNIRVCIYSNKDFADKNSPYCGGSIAYLSTNSQGIVIFTGLEPKKYYINARGSVGAIVLTNKWSADMQSAEATTGQLSFYTVILK